MTVAEVTEEIRKLSDADKELVIEITAKLLHHDPLFARRNRIAAMRVKLSESAQIMKAEYAADTELMAFKALDGEDFLDA